MWTPGMRSGEPMATLEHKRSIELLYLALCVGRPREGDQHSTIWGQIKDETLDAMIRDRVAGRKIAPDAIDARLTKKEERALDRVVSLLLRAEVSQEIQDLIIQQIGTIAGSIEFRVGLSTELRGLVVEVSDPPALSEPEE